MGAGGAKMLYAQDRGVLYRGKTQKETGGCKHPPVSFLKDFRFRHLAKYEAQSVSWLSPVWQSQQGLT